MTDLATIRAQRDTARKKHIAQFAAPFEFDRFRKDLDALLRAERRLALAEAAERLDRKANESDGRAIRLTSHMGYSHSAAFLRQLSENAE